MQLAYWYLSLFLLLVLMKRHFALCIASSMVNFTILRVQMLSDGPAPPRVPPASKEVVAKLPVITLTEEILAKLGKDAECAICKENLVLNDKMQELPCRHTFHPPCLKPWLVYFRTCPDISQQQFVVVDIIVSMLQDEHNSCPICRYELQTDDHAYESWKEREKEAEEERKGAENAVRGGEYMYV